MGIVVCYNIHHGCILHHRHIGQAAHCLHEMARDFLSRDILMEQDTLPAVSALSRERQSSILVPGETDAVSDQITNHILR